MATVLRSARIAALAVALAVTASGCGGSAGSTDKAGGDSEPVTLRMANGYFHLDYEPAVAHFVQRVGERSDGALTINVEQGWAGEDPGSEQQVVRDVAEGTVDIGWAGTRIFDTLDVTAFQALTAALLIDSYPLQQAVIDSDIPAEMLAGVEELGLTGLGVLAGGLRKPIAVERPLLGPDDWAGLTFQAFRSDGHADAIRALGAEPTDILFDPLDDALISGEVGGFEKNLLIVQINNLQARAPYVTTNVNLWPETAVLFANSERFEELTDQQREWLHQAADDAAERSTELADQDAEVLAQLCDAGARAAEASDDDLAALRASLDPVYAALEQDPQTKVYLDQIEELKSGAPDGEPLVPPSDCIGPAPGTEAAPDGTSDELDGTYRWTLTADDALAQGSVEDQTAEALAGYPYTHTITLADGNWQLEWRGGGESGPEGPGTYTVDGDRVTFDWPPGLVLVFTFTVHDNGDLTLEPVPPMPQGDAFVWSTVPWVKID